VKERKIKEKNSVENHQGKKTKKKNRSSLHSLNHVTEKEGQGGKKNITKKKRRRTETQLRAAR